MKEKEIVKGSSKELNTLSMILWGVSIISLIIALVLGPAMHSDDGFVETYLFPQAGEGSAVFFWLFMITLVLGTYFFIAMRSCEICVTNKRVYGKTKFGKLVDLPFDMISSVGTGFPKGVFVATSSGLIKFWMLSNQQEVYSAISDMLKDRQDNERNNNDIKDKNTLSSADEIKKYKELLDDGIITKEEFEKKKKELLG